MPVRVSPTEPNPTHHVALRDRNGQQVGLILCNANGNVSPRYGKNPVERTALKTTSGNNSYSDFPYPYSPITQDDWSGGRGNLDFERDTTKFYDSFRLRTGRSNKVFLGPQEKYSTGNRKQINYVPGNVMFYKLINNKYVARYFLASENMTAARVWIMLRRKGNPGPGTIEICSDGFGFPDTVLTSATFSVGDMADTTSEWVIKSISVNLTSSTLYWIKVYASQGDNSTNYWELGVSPGFGNSRISGDGSAWTGCDFDLYFRITETEQGSNAIFYEYKGQQYVVISGSGAPKLYMNGDRGVVTAGSMSEIIDSTKAWTVNTFAGCMVMIVNGAGKNQERPYRYIVSNTSTKLNLASNFDEPTATGSTEYIIVNTSQWREISGHGLTAPVTDVYVSKANVIYFAMGDNVNIRRMREYNNAGVWTLEYADEPNTATYLEGKPRANKIFRANNSNSTISSADEVDWGTNLTFGTAIAIGNVYNKITGLICYPDENGSEAMWIFKTDIPWVLPSSGNAYTLNVGEMRTMMDTSNGVASITNNVYLYFSLLNGMERYYGGNVDDVGPNLGEGMPANRAGPVVALLSYPGKFFAGVNAGLNYSSVIERDNNGWHERYRGPKGQQVKAIGYQVIPGMTVDKMWIYQADDLIWLPFATDELKARDYSYTHEGALVLSRMHAGMMDVQKLVKTIKLWTDHLEENKCWIEVDYRLNEESTWRTLDNIFNVSPQSKIDLTSIYGMAGKRIQLRLRFYTADASKTPMLLAVIIEAVTRIGVKYMYPLTFRLMDNDETLAGGEADDITDGMAKLKIIEDWADDSSDSMLFMESQSRLWHGKMVFINPPDVIQAQVGSDGANDVFICSATLQEA